ncbi:MAG: glycosyltransferase [Actinobacteria bacterium]|nr:glycosyltransferase [Actinomycetota bacterium]
MRILQVANFVTATSGGQRVALDELAARYVGAGHVCGRLVPGEVASVTRSGPIELRTVVGPRLPMSGGYRVAFSRSRVERAVTEFMPDLIELSDRTTLAWLPAWAEARGIPTVHFTHESVERVIADRSAMLRLGKPMVRRWRLDVASSCSAVVAASRWAAAEFDGLNDDVHVVPLGVDREIFNPVAGLGCDDEPYVMFAGRLSTEKRPEVVVDAVRLLTESGRPIRLVVAGSGPLEDRVRRAATGLDVRFLGFVQDRRVLAGLMARASVVAAPSPFETFGLTVAESLSTGTPVVVSETSAAVELLDHGCGVAVPPTTEGVASGLHHVLGWDRSSARTNCVARSEMFSWDVAARRMLGVFDRVCVRRTVREAA